MFVRVSVRPFGALECPLEPLSHSLLGSPRAHVEGRAKERISLKTSRIMSYNSRIRPSLTEVRFTRWTFYGPLGPVGPVLRLRKGVNNVWRGSNMEIIDQFVSSAAPFAWLWNTKATVRNPLWQSEFRSSCSLCSLGFHSIRLTSL